MATYKVWLTVKDSYGNIKEIEGGKIDVDLTNLDEAELSEMHKKLDNIFATDVELEQQVGNVQQQVDATNSIKYTDFFDEKSTTGGNN
jgi:hypothetical protein